MFVTPIILLSVLKNPLSRFLFVRERPLMSGFVLAGMEEIRLVGPWALGIIVIPMLVLFSLILLEPEDVIMIINIPISIAVPRTVV